MKSFNSDPGLHVKAYSMREVLFEGAAFSLSAANRLGPFDVLPGHANMLAILTDCTVRIHAPDGDQNIAINNGVLKVSSNAVTLFINL